MPWATFLSGFADRSDWPMAESESRIRLRILNVGDAVTPMVRIRLKSVERLHPAGRLRFHRGDRLEQVRVLDHVVLGDPVTHELHGALGVGGNGVGDAQPSRRPGYRRCPSPGSWRPRSSRWDQFRRTFSSRSWFSWSLPPFSFLNAYWPLRPRGEARASRGLVVFHARGRTARRSDPSSDRRRPGRSARSPWRS
jgi:hypothetical protein